MAKKNGPRFLKDEAGVVNLDEKCKEWSKLRSKCNFNTNVGDWLERFGVRGLWPGYEWFSFWYFLIVLLIRAFIYFTIYFTLWNFIWAGVIYAVIHGAAFTIGTVLSNRGYKQGMLYDREVTDAWKRYMRQKYKENFIDEKGVIRFTNGFVVTNGAVAVPMYKDYGKFVFVLRKLETRPGIADDLYEGKIIDLSELVSSVKFKDHFAVYVEKESKVSAMTYLSPILQLAMIKNIKFIEKFREITVEDGVFSAKIAADPIPEITTEQIYHWSIDRSVRSYFDEIDTYCDGLGARAAEILEGFEKIDCIRGVV